MTTISVPIPAHQVKFIDRMVKLGIGTNKADVVRRALAKFEEDQAVEAVLRSEQEAREGKILRGDLRELLKKFA
jgi:Arc/MetJ-type ribon-helix-helix transcriptional regulator